MPDPLFDPTLRQRDVDGWENQPSDNGTLARSYASPDMFDPSLRERDKGGWAKPALQDPNSFDTATSESTEPIVTPYTPPTGQNARAKPVAPVAPLTPTPTATTGLTTEPLPEPLVKPGDVPIVGQLASFFNPQDPTRVPILGGLAEAISETTRPTTGPGLFDALGQSGGILNEVAANLYSGKDVDPTFGAVAAHELGADKQTAQAIGTAAGYGSALTGALGGGTNALLNAAMGLERDARDVPLLGNAVRVGEGIMNILAGATNATAGGLIAAGNILGRGVSDMSGLYGAKGGVEGLWAPNSRTQEYLAQLGNASRKVAQGNDPNAQDYILGAFESADPLEQIVATLINPINAIDIVPIGGLQKARGVARATGKVNLLNEAKVFGKTVVPRVVATGENAPLVVRMLFDLPQTVRNEAGAVPLLGAEKLGIRKPVWWEKAMPTVMENKARGYEMLRRSLDNVDARMTDLDAEGFKAFLDNAVTSARTGELSKEFFGKYPQMAAPDAQTAIQLTGGFDVPNAWGEVTKARGQAEKMLAEGGTPKEGVWKTAVESLRTNKTLDANKVLDTAAKYDLRTRWGQHVAGSIRDGLGITDRGVIKKMFDGLKSWEGALYIGLNPGSWIRNGWDNQKNLLLYGINPKYDYKKIAAAYQDIGWDPFREMDTAAKEGYAKMRQVAAAQPANSYGAFGASVPGKIQEIFPWFNNWEQGAQRTAYWSGFDKARRINWRRGNWFKRMPKTLEDALDSISPRMSNLVYGAIEKGHSQKEIYDYINQLHKSVFVESFLDDPEFMRAMGGALGASKDLSPETARLVMASHADGINEAIITALSRTDVPREQALREELAKYRAELVAHHQNLRGQEAPNMRQAAQGAANGTPPTAQGGNPLTGQTRNRAYNPHPFGEPTYPKTEPTVQPAGADPYQYIVDPEVRKLMGLDENAAPVPEGVTPDAVTPVAPPMTVEQYVDDYMAGKGRGNTPEDLEYQQFAANHAEAIEQEFQRRAAGQAVPPSGETVTTAEAATPNRVGFNSTAPESVTPVEPTSEIPAPVQVAPDSPVAARQQTIVDNAPAQPPVPEGDFPETDIRRYVYENPALNVVDEGAWDYLIQLKNADGSPAFTPAQLSTWKPETLERIAIERGYASSTYNDFLRLFEKKTGKDAAQSGNYFKNLLNAEIGRKGFFDPEIANIAPFQNWDDVKARPFDAYRLVRGYNEYPTQAEGTFKLQLRLKMIEDQIPDELQQGIETIYDALGATAAKRAGVDVDTWWTQNMAGVEGGTPTSQLRGLQQKAAGATDYLPDARRLLRFFKGEANASTYVHEAAHVFLPTLDASDLDEVAKWTGLTDGAQLRELHMRWVRQDDMGALPNATHKRSKTAYQFRDMDGAISDKERYQIAQEKFARGFEKYLSEGVAPTLALERAFEQFKDFLLEIYRGITGSDIDVKLTDEMRSLYGRMLDADANETGIAKTRLKRLEDASVGEIAPPQVRETGAGELPPQTDEGQYSLFQETDDMPGAMGPNVADAAAEEIRTLDAMLPLIHQSVMDAALKKPVVLDPLTAKALSEYLQKEINPALADSIQASNVIGRWNQSRTVLNYDARTNFDEWLSYVFPFMYWRRAQATNWIQRFMEKPNLLRAYVMAQQELDRMTNSDEYPKRLRGKLRLPMPFMDDWMGGSVYFDPLESFLPMQSIYGAELQRAEYSNAGNALLGLPADDGDIAKLLRKKAMRGELSRSDVENAIATQSGELWEQGKQEARADVASPDNLTGLFTPHAPLQWLVAALTDNTDAIGPLLPLSRPIRSITGAMGMNGGEGVNIEAPVRNLLRGAGMSDLPEFDAWEEYRVIKTLAEMVDDGLIDADTAKLAMMEKSGKAWRDAAQRASATKGNVVNQTLGMLAPTGVFPTGEQGIRQAQKEREALYDSEVVRLGGNPDAMTYDERKQFLTEKGAFEDGQALPQFFDAHPELAAKTAVGQEGEERLKNWMQTAIWKRYNALGDLDKRMVRGQLDKEFVSNFLNKDTRDYAAVSLLDLIRAGQQLDAVIPNTPKGESEAMDIARADPRKLATLASPEQNQRYTAFSDKMDAQFDKDAMFRKADEYHALTTDEEKRDYKKRNPDYAAYAKAWAVFNDQNTDILDTLKGVGARQETSQSIGNSPGAIYAAGVVAIGYPNYDAFKADSETYKALKAKDPDAAKAYLNAHPLLQRAYAFGNALYGDKEKTNSGGGSSGGSSKPRKIYNEQDYVRTVKPSKPRSYGQNQPRLKPVEYWVKRLEAQKRWQQRQPQMPPMPMPSQ